MTDSMTHSSDALMISLENVNKWYGQFHVLKDINLQVKPRERIVLCGPSGSGKSTTIRCINHLEEHQQGRIVVDGIHLNDDVRNIERVRTEVGMVFQHFNLFPHLTVLQNCTLAPSWVERFQRRKLMSWPCTICNACVLPSMHISFRASSLADSSSVSPSPAHSV